MDTIRKIVFNDLIEITNLEKEIFEDSWALRTIENQITSAQTINLAIVQNTKIIGYILARIYMDFLEIERIGVVKNERRKKVGEKLISEIETIARHMKKERITLEVAENNTNAIKLYNKLSYKKNGVRKKYYKLDNQNAVLMSRELD